MVNNACVTLVLNNRIAPRHTAVLAENHPEMRQQLSRLLQKDLDVVCAVDDGISALRAVTEHQPSVAILDVSMPKMSGIEVAQELKNLKLATRIIFISIQNDRDYLQAMTSLGASYVAKVRMRTDLLVAIHEMLNGRTFISPS
jgi:DNA-binding NarL/FixJ family response regulator